MPQGFAFIHLLISKYLLSTDFALEGTWDIESW